MEATQRHKNGSNANQDSREKKGSDSIAIYLHIQKREGGTVYDWH